MPPSCMITYSYSMHTAITTYKKYGPSKLLYLACMVVQENIVVDHDTSTLIIPCILKYIFSSQEPACLQIIQYQKISYSIDCKYKRRTRDKS